MKTERSITGRVFNIQKFSLNDGPGIRTVVFLKGCPLRCRWCSNPESQCPGFQILWDTKVCVRCHHCAEVCLKQAISYRENTVMIDHSRCDGCGKCVKECVSRALKPTGEIKTVQNVLDLCMQDLPFYEESGGGVTLSGGEMLGQPEFSRAFLAAAKEEGLHTCCETTGYADPKVFRSVIELIDYVLFDMKHYDPLRHKQGTGVTNDLPLANMKTAVSMGKQVLPRIPVIPGFNDSLDDARGFVSAIQSIGLNQCQLLPFHQFGENKYDLLNMEYDYRNISNLHKEDLEPYRMVFEENGVHAWF